MTKQELNKVTQELDDEHELLTRAVEFWGKNVEKLLKKINKLEKNTYQLDFEEKYEKLLIKLESLVRRGNIEKEITEKYVNKVKKTIKARDRKS